MSLSQREIEQFIANGFVVLRKIFTPKVAQEARQNVWSRVVKHKSKCEWYSKSYVHLEETIHAPAFDGILTARPLKGAIDQLLGEDRWKSPKGLGWWPLLLPRFDPKDDPMTAGFDPNTDRYTDYGWHFDGEWSPFKIDIGVVGAFLFSDTDDNAGATRVISGSHLEVARVFRNSPAENTQAEQLRKKLPYVVEEKRFQKRVVNLTGNAGDIWLFHPMLLHCPGRNSGTDIRFAAFPHFLLRGKLRSNPDTWSPLEKTILSHRKI
jgi:hypothetical protein